MAVRDVVLIMVLLFLFGMGFFVLHFVVSTAVDELVSVSTINQSQDAVDAFESGRTVVNRLDYLIFMIFIGLILGMLITGWFIGGNPIFMFIYFIVVVLVVVISAVLSNTWESVTQASVFGTTIASFPIANHILLFFPYYMSVIGIIGLIVMFAKPYFAEGYQ